MCAHVHVALAPQRCISARAASLPQDPIMKPMESIVHLWYKGIYLLYINDTRKYGFMAYLPIYLHKPIKKSTIHVGRYGLDSLKMQRITS